MANFEKLDICMRNDMCIFGKFEFFKNFTRLQGLVLGLRLGLL